MAGIKVAVSGTVMSKDLTKVSKKGNPYATITIGWMDKGDEEGRGASAGIYTAMCALETAQAVEQGEDITLVSRGKEENFAIKPGFYEASKKVAAAGRRAA